MRQLALIIGLALCGPAVAAAQLRAVTYAAGFTSPIAFEQDTSDPATQYVAQRRGVVRVIRNGAVQATAGRSITGGYVYRGATILGGITSFGVDAAGELYIVSYSSGAILEVVGAPAAPTNLRIIR